MPAAVDLVVSVLLFDLSKDLSLFLANCSKFFFRYLTLSSRLDLRLIAIFVLTALIIKFSKFNTSKIYANPKTLLYILSSVFGFIHIFNFTITLKFFIILPFIILPYIFAGLLLSYLRMKFSLFHSIIFHALMNGSVLIPKFIFENVR